MVNPTSAPTGSAENPKMAPAGSFLSKRVDAIAEAYHWFYGKENGEDAEEILQKKQADLVLVGRESLRNPHFPLHAARELDEQIRWPDSYLRADRERLS